MSDERDSPGNHDNATPAPRTGGGAELYTPDGNTSEGAPRNNKNNHQDIQGQSGRQETGGRDDPDPTRFGDWEIKGRCIDF